MPWSCWQDLCNMHIDKFGQLETNLCLKDTWFAQKQGLSRVGILGRNRKSQVPFRNRINLARPFKQNDLLLRSTACFAWLDIRGRYYRSARRHCRSKLAQSFFVLTGCCEITVLSSWTCTCSQEQNFGEVRLMLLECCVASTNFAIILPRSLVSSWNGNQGRVSHQRTIPT